MPKKVTVFTTNRCSYCAMVKRYLDSKKIKYEIRNMEEDPSAQAIAFEASGALTAPITLVDKENGEREVVVGYNLARLAPALS